MRGKCWGRMGFAVAAGLVPIASFDSNGLLSKELYPSIPKLFSLGKTYNAINLGTYDKNYQRILVAIDGIEIIRYSPFSVIACFFTESKSSIAPRVIVKWLVENPEQNYFFLYKDNGNTFTFYFCTTASYSSNFENIYLRYIKQPVAEYIDLENSQFVKINA